MIAFVASDLVWASRIKATAEAVGISAKRLFNPGGLTDLVATDEVRLVLIDLESEDAAALIEALRGPAASDAVRQIRTIAWAPHVLVDEMRAAKDAGIDRVLPRGAFASKLESILTDLAGG